MTLNEAIQKVGQKVRFQNPYLRVDNSDYILEGVTVKTVDGKVIQSAQIYHKSSDYCKLHVRLSEIT